MARIYSALVRQASTTVGTGAYTVAGTVTGHQTFADRCTVADVFRYMAREVDGSGNPTGAYEYGTGTYSAANTITRTAVIESSNADAAVSWGAGTKIIDIVSWVDAILGQNVDSLDPVEVTETKPSPVDGDQLVMLDSADSGAPKLVTKAQLLAGVSGGGASVVSRDEYEALAAEIQEARGQRSRLSLRIGTVSNFASPNAGGVVIGQYFDNSFQGTASSTLAGAANRFELAPFYTSVPQRIDRIGSAVSTAVAASLIKMVIYDSDEDGWPNNLLLETGDLSGAAVAFVQETIDFTFDSGRQYWVGVRHSSTCTLRTINVSSAVNLGLTTNAGTQYATVLRRTLTFGTAAPATYNFVNADRSINVTPPSVRMRAAANVPAAMRYAQWGAVPGTDQITIDIGELPSDGGSAITALEYRIDGGTATALTGTGTGSRVVAATAGARVVEVRAVSAIGNAPWSDAKTRTVVSGSATAPAAFTVGQWTSTPGDTEIVINITALPSDGGSAITALQYTLNGSTWTSFAGTGTGSRTITGLTNDTSYPVQIRAVNAIGNGAASDTKNTTPVAASGETFIRFATLVNMTETGSAGTGWIYSGTVVEGYAGGSDYTLASGVAGGATVNTGLGGNTPSPLLGFYTTAAGVWNDSFHAIAYPFFFGGGPEWQFNGPGFSDLVTTTRTYVDGDRVRIRFDSANGVVAEIARAAAPDTWLQIGAGTVTRAATLYPRLHAHDGGGSGATAVFTAPFVSP